MNAGGNLVFLTRPVTDKSFESISSLLGIKKYEKELIDTSGIKILSDVMMGANGFESKTRAILNSSINLELISGTSPLLKSYTNVPLLWEKNYGKGRFTVFNGTFLNEKNNRGILLGLCIDIFIMF